MTSPKARTRNGGVGVSFTPCVLPMVPITMGLIGARNAGSRLHAVSLSATYVFGLALDVDDAAHHDDGVGEEHGEAQERVLGGEREDHDGEEGVRGVDALHRVPHVGGALAPDPALGGVATAAHDARAAQRAVERHEGEHLARAFAVHGVVVLAQLGSVEEAWVEADGTGWKGHAGL